jgi:hypothetical protein
MRLACAPKRIAAKRIKFPTTKPPQPTAEHPFDPSHCARQRPSGLRLIDRSTFVAHAGLGSCRQGWLHARVNQEVHHCGARSPGPIATTQVFLQLDVSKMSCATFRVVWPHTMATLRTQDSFIECIPQIHGTS